jgi:hypothetical protein
MLLLTYTRPLIKNENSQILATSVSRFLMVKLFTSNQNNKCSIESLNELVFFSLIISDYSMKFHVYRLNNEWDFRGTLVDRGIAASGQKQHIPSLHMQVNRPPTSLPPSTTRPYRHVTNSGSRCRCHPKQPHRGSHSHGGISQQRGRPKGRDESIEDSKLTPLASQSKFLLINVLQAAIQGKIASIEAELAAQRTKLGEVTKGLTYVQEPFPQQPRTQRDEYMLM